jgi:hypothetical protein
MARPRKRSSMLPVPSRTSASVRIQGRWKDDTATTSPRTVVRRRGAIAEMTVVLMS